jgi:uncharacterized membrane protein YdjX (TVP38/TMEM64 family)
MLMSVEADATTTRLDYEPRRGHRGSLATVAVIATALPVLGSVAVLSAGPFVAEWLRSQGATGVAWFVVAFTLLGGVAVTPTYTTSILAGWTFGFAIGYPAVLLATVGGAALCYATARTLAARRVAEAYRDHPRWDVVRRALLHERPLKTVWVVLLLRLAPVLPFGTTNVLLATSGVRTLPYLVGSLLGLMPRAGIVALAAAGAEKLDLRASQSWWMIAAGFIATGACIVVMAVIGRRALNRAAVAVSGRAN